jgi:hypothetical protein
LNGALVVSTQGFLMSYILKTKMTNEKYGTCLKTNDLNFGHIYGLNKKIMTRPKTQINHYINQS